MANIVVQQSASAAAQGEASENQEDLYIIKRDGSQEAVSFDKILNRVKSLGSSLSNGSSLGAKLNVNYSQLVMKVVDQLYNNMPTYVIDELTAEQCASLITKHLDYGILAGRIIVSNNHKNTQENFAQTMDTLYQFRDVHGQHSPLIHPDVWRLSQEHGTFFQSILDYSRDYLLDYFGFKTLERAYLMKIGKKIIERPQHMWLRVALGIHGANLRRVKETYELMSQKYFTHATPTLFNAGTNHPQLSSCYLIGMEDDSVDGIYNTLKDCAKISKWAGGIGLHVHNIRAAGTHINGTNGISNGIAPMLRVFNTTARYIDQGGGRRSGSFAIYMEPWHADIEDFLDMRKNHGDEEMRARDLFYGLWIPDLFMTKVKNNEDWCLFCPHKCPGLADCYGAEFNALYEKYRLAGQANKTLPARTLWFKILDSQMETGTPYLLYKDPANQKSNQQNLGVIKSSNLCVAPETLILTEDGYLEIQTLVGQTLKVWNGSEFSATTIQQTGENQELIMVETSDGCMLECTPYHKFYLHDHTTVAAQELQENAVLLQCEYPVLEGNQSYTVSNKIVPVNANLKTKMEWLSDYYNLDLYNSIIIAYKLYLSHSSKDFLFQVKLMLQLCGINTTITKDDVTEKYTLIISDLHLLIELGFKLLRINLTVTTDIKEKAEKQSICIKKITRTGRNADTYCFNEPKKHAGLFNGIITGQCTEIIEYSDHEQTAVCNLASIGLPKFVLQDKTFDYPKLHEVAKVVTYNLNKIIDVNFYPTEKTRVSNLLHRPIGIGVQGLADVFALMDIAFTSAAAKEVNKLIFETIYHAALESSMEIARDRAEAMQVLAQCQSNLFTRVDVAHLELFSKVDAVSRDYAPGAEYDDLVQEVLPIPAELHYLSGLQMGAYSSFAGSPASKGLLQFNLWGLKETASQRYDWLELKEQIQVFGLRNSLLVAPMPTASTSQILGNNECFEPFTSNLYSRRTNAGEFVLPNKYLMAELLDLGLWNEALKDNIILNKGSIQQLTGVSAHLKEKYKTVWEIPMKHLIDMAADRAPYICQSQSLNLWVEDPDYKALTAMHFYAWQAGLKTGIYYLRRKAKHQAQQFTIRPPGQQQEKQQQQQQPAAKEKDEDCLMCSS
jgi:ribonucleotide reductase alpha subunit